MIDSTLFDQADGAYQGGDLEAAFRLFLKAAEDGDASAMSRLALMYGDGEGVDYDLAKSIYWDKKAIAAGNLSSLSNLAITYRTLGDIRKARHYFDEAIQSGDGDAALELAKLYMVSDKEKQKQKQKVMELLRIVLNSKSVCISSVEEAKEIIKEMQQDNW
jgi:TPR repeat protein